MIALPNRNSFETAVSVRPGTSTVEVMVALTLLVSVLSVATPLVVKHGRLLSMQRQYRLALDEISNQLERLSVLPEEELAQAVEHVAPAEFTSSRLPGVELRGRVDAADFGRRVTLSIWWDEPERIKAPISMTTWLLPRSPATRGEP